LHISRPSQIAIVANRKSLKSQIEMPSNLDRFKDFFSGKSIHAIAASDMQPESKRKLIKLKLVLSTISYLIGVAGVSILTVYVNDKYQTNLLDITKNESRAKIEERFIEASTQIQDKYVDKYTAYDTRKKYYFLDLMRFTCPDTKTREQYKKMFLEFDENSGALARKLERQDLSSQMVAKAEEGAKNLAESQDSTIELTEKQREVRKASAKKNFAEADVIEIRLFFLLC
jgi:hypothetical protein